MISPEEYYRTHKPRIKGLYRSALPLVKSLDEKRINESGLSTCCQAQVKQMLYARHACSKCLKVLGWEHENFLMEVSSKGEQVIQEKLDFTPTPEKDKDEVIQL